MTDMKLWNQRPQARAPHWPLGYVGRPYIKKSRAWGDDEGLMAVEKLPIRELIPIASGWTIVAGDKGEWIFDVDDSGESHDCFPWDADMEKQYQRDGGDLPLVTGPLPRPEPPRKAGRSPFLSLADALPRRELPDFVPGETTEHKAFELMNILAVRRADLVRGDFFKHEIPEAEAVIRDLEHRIAIAELRETAVLRDEVRRGVLPKALLELDDDIAKVTANLIKNKADRERTEARKRAADLARSEHNEDPEVRQSSNIGREGGEPE